MNYKELLRLVVMLSLICLGAAAALSGVAAMTSEPIRKQLEKETVDAVRAVLPPHDKLSDDFTRFEDGQAVFTGLSGGKPVGFAYKISTRKGYSGEIVSMLGVNPGGAITGIAVLKHAETPGLGANITLEKYLHPLIWKDDAGKVARTLANTKWGATKDGGDIDQITGATITTRAVAESVEAGLKKFPLLKTGGPETKTDEAEPETQVPDAGEKYGIKPVGEDVPQPGPEGEVPGGITVKTLTK